MDDQAMTSAYQQLPDIPAFHHHHSNRHLHLHQSPSRQHVNVANQQQNSPSQYCVVENDAGDVMMNNNFVPNRFLRASRRVQHALASSSSSKQPQNSSPPPAYECINGLHHQHHRHQQQQQQQQMMNITNKPPVIYSISTRQQQQQPQHQQTVVSEVSFAHDNNNNNNNNKVRKNRYKQKVKQFFEGLSFGKVSASVQRSIAWCLGWYGYFIGKFPYIMLIFGLTLGFGCASGLRYLRLAPIVDTDFNDPSSPIENDREMMSGFNAYPCNCERARKLITTSPATTTKITEQVQSPSTENDIIAEIKNLPHRFSCAHPNNRDKSCHCHSVNLGFIMLDEKHKHGFVDLDKFQKLIKIESMIWNNFSAAPKYPDFNFHNLCVRRDKRDPNSPCSSFRLQTVDTEELRGALVFNVLPFPYFENTKIMSELVGSVKTVTDSSGNIWASSVRALRENFELCHADMPEANEAYKIWDDAINRRLEQENKRYFEPVLGIGVRWQFADKMTKYAEIAVINLVPKFLATIVAVAFWAVAAMTGSDAVLSKPWLGLIGVSSTLLANAAGIGFMAYQGKDFNYACAGVPFLTLAIGLDDMFALVTGLHHTSPLEPVPVRMQRTMSEAGSAIFITFLTNLVAQSVGSRTPYKIISEFSLYSLVCMVFDFILQLTIFCPSLAILAMLETRGSNACCCCAVMAKRNQNLYVNRSSCYLICCSRIDFAEKGNRDNGNEEDKASSGDDDGPASSALLRVVQSYARFLIKTQIRYVVLLLYLAYLAVTVYGLTTVSFGMKMDNLAPYASPEAAFLRLNREAFNDYREVKVMFNEAKIDYHDPDVQHDIEMIYRKIEHSGFFHPSPTMTRWWLREYLDYLRLNETKYQTVINDTYQFFDTLNYDYVREKNRKWLIDDDLRSCGIDHAIVCKSRGHVIATNLKESTRQIAAYEFANKLELQYAKYRLLLFLPEFAEFEMKRNTVYISVYYVLVTVASAGCVAVFFVPHLVLIFWIVAVLLSEIIGLVGLLPFIGIDLDLVSLTMLIINVGYVVDFIMHLSFDFMMAPGNNRQDKVIHALTDVGHALIPAGAGTVMSVLAMSTTGMYIYEVYFRSLSLAVVISAIHSCCFLPVFLSFFGPLGDSEIIATAEIVNNKTANDDSNNNNGDGDAQRTGRPLVNLMALVNRCDDNNNGGQQRLRINARHRNNSKFFHQPVGSGSGGVVSRNVVYLAGGEKNEDDDNDADDVIIIGDEAATTTATSASNNSRHHRHHQQVIVDDDDEKTPTSEKNNNTGAKWHQQVMMMAATGGGVENGGFVITTTDDDDDQDQDQQVMSTGGDNRQIKRNKEMFERHLSERRHSNNNNNNNNNTRIHYHRRRRSVDDDDDDNPSSSAIDSVNIVEIVYGTKQRSTNETKQQNRHYYRSSRYNNNNNNNNNNDNNNRMSISSSVERSNNNNNHIQRRQQTAAKIAKSRRNKRFSSAEETSSHHHHHHHHHHNRHHSSSQHSTNNNNNNYRIRRSSHHNAS